MTHEEIKRRDEAWKRFAYEYPMVPRTKQFDAGYEAALADADARVAALGYNFDKPSWNAALDAAIAKVRELSAESKKSPMSFVEGVVMDDVAKELEALKCKQTPYAAAEGGES